MSDLYSYTLFVCVDRMIGTNEANDAQLFYIVRSVFYPLHHINFVVNSSFIVIYLAKRSLPSKSQPRDIV